MLGSWSTWILYYLYLLSKSVCIPSLLISCKYVLAEFFSSLCPCSTVVLYSFYTHGSHKNRKWIWDFVIPLPWPKLICNPKAYHIICAGWVILSSCSSEENSEAKKDLSNRLRLITFLILVIFVYRKVHTSFVLSMYFFPIWTYLHTDLFIQINMTRNSEASSGFLQNRPNH